VTLRPLNSLRPYDRSWLRSDLIAGLTLWAVLVPEALALASIAGVSPVVGLYAAPGALLLYAIFGGSRLTVVGPISSAAILSAAAVGEYASGGSANFVVLTAALAVVAGAIAIFAGLLRLGFLSNFISAPVLRGFIIGLALTIIVGQLPKLLGVDGGSGDFFEKLWHLIGNLGETSAATLVVGAVSLGLILALRRLSPSFPAYLLAVVGGIVAVRLFDLDQHGVAIVGDIQGGLPAFGLPDASAGDYLKLVPGAAGVALIAFAEAFGAAKAFATGEDRVDADQELVGVGAANVAAGLSSGMVVGGSLSKTAVNHSGGARSQLSGIATAVLVIITLLFLTQLFEDLPEATLAAVVIAAVIQLVDFDSLSRLYRVQSLRRLYGPAARPDFIAAVAALLGVLVFDLLPGLFIGIAVSLLLLLYRSSKPNVARLGRLPGTERFVDLKRAPETEQPPGIVVLRVESGIFFANAEAVMEAVTAAAKPQEVTGIVIDAETVPFIDVTAVQMLSSLSKELDERGVRLVIARDVGQIRDVIESTDAVEGLKHLYPTVQSAVEALTEKPG
jgi:SulP family sulfate permease